MPNILLNDIVPIAQRESYRMRHYFMGVEHLFIALLQMNGSIASRVIEESGFSPEYVINAVRLKIGKGIPRQSFADFPETPRVQRVLKYASKISVENQHTAVDERDLLLAILVEQDSIPVRVLRALKLDIESLAVSAQNQTTSNGNLEFPVKIEFSENFKFDKNLEKPFQHILKRMFHGYARIRIESQLAGGYTKAKLYVVTPIQVDNVQHAPVVVKIGRTADIQDEAQRYESHVKPTLPPFTARLEEKPTAPDNSEFAGLKYTFIVGPEETPRDLRSMIHEWGAIELGRWLRKQLYPTFGKIWWMQGRVFRFETWREYDWLLPPVLTLEYMDVTKPPDESVPLRFPIKRSRLSQLRPGDIATVENFIVQKIDHENNVVTLALGNGATVEKAYRIKIKGIDLNKNTFYRGEIIDSITGRVWETRNDLLAMAARDLLPDFSLTDELIPATVDKMRKITNPLKSYEPLLDWQINGVFSKTHGDMHLGNIMVGPSNHAFLIDFAHSRDGHTAFDWACLEISLLSEVVMPVAGEDWNAARQVLEYLMQINAGQIPAQDTPLGIALSPVVDVRRTMQDIMQKCGGSIDWMEYHIALTMCALRAITWDTMSEASRRLMFLVAGLCIHELRDKTVAGERETPSPDETDVNTTV